MKLLLLYLGAESSDAFFFLIMKVKDEKGIYI